MKKMLAFFALLIYCSFSLLVTASALAPKSSSFYVADYANVISSSTEQTIIAANAKLEKLTRGQIVVVTVESLEGLKSSEYASKLMNDWGVGDAKLNNGMLLLLAPKDKKGWLIQGSGIAATFTSTKINALLDKYFWPDFDKGKYDSAVNAMFRQMINWYEGFYKVTIPIASSAESATSNPAATYYGGSKAASGSSGSSYGSSGSNTYASSGGVSGNSSVSVSVYSNASDNAGIIVFMFFFFIIIIIVAIMGSFTGSRSGNYGAGSYKGRRRGPGFGGGFVGGYMVGRSMGRRREDEEDNNDRGFGSGLGGQSGVDGGARDDNENSAGFGSGFGGQSSGGGGGRDDDNSGGFGGFSGGGGGGSFDSGSSLSGGSSFDGGGGFSGGGGGGRD